MKKIFPIIIIFINIHVLFAYDAKDFYGNYKGENKDYNELIYFFQDNQFKYCVNFGDHYRIIDGKYRIEHNQILCKINKINLQGWKENDIHEIIFQIINKDQIKLTTDYGYDISNSKIFKFKKPVNLKSKVENLRLRNYFNTNSNIITSLSKGDSVEVLGEFINYETNSGKGKWLFVKNINNVFGFCYKEFME